MVHRPPFTDKGIAELKKGATRYSVPDPRLAGHYVRVTPAGSKSFVAVARDPSGRQVWATVGLTELYDLDEARGIAREAIKRIKAGQAPFPTPAKAESFKAVAENWIGRHVAAKRLRSQPEIERRLARYVYPTWEKREFAAIKRSDVAKLLDSIQDKHGAQQADKVLADVGAIMRWHASRDDNYRAVVAGKMRRTDPKDRKRARVLDDSEIRLVWHFAADSGRFGAILQLALLTAQRREKITAMRWRDILATGTWTIPAEDREKGNGGALALPDAALAIIERQPRIEGNEYVFAGRGAGHFNGFSPSKRTFDEKLAKKLGEENTVPRWTIHDLRRTARSLMSRTGVRPDIAERVMGHTISGVEGVYDRHTYHDEKADALQRLATQIERILNPAPANVVPLREAAQ